MGGTIHVDSKVNQATLEIAGAACKIYTDGQQIVKAFESVKPGEYDGILMDIQMPNMDGHEAAKMIRKSKNPLGKTIPIIVMTANAFTEDVNASLACGMNAHISKPIDMALLERTIRRLKSQEENYNGKNNS